MRRDPEPTQTHDLELSGSTPSAPSIDSTLHTCDRACTCQQRHQRRDPDPHRRHSTPNPTDEIPADPRTRRAHESGQSATTLLKLGCGLEPIDDVTATEGLRVGSCARRVRSISVTAKSHRRPHWSTARAESRRPLWPPSVACGSGRAVGTRFVRGTRNADVLQSTVVAIVKRGPRIWTRPGRENGEEERRCRPAATQ